MTEQQFQKRFKEEFAKIGGKVITYEEMKKERQKKK